MMNHQLDVNNFDNLSLLGKTQGQMMTILPFLTGPLIHRFPKRKEQYQYFCLDDVQGKVPIFGDLYFFQKNTSLKEATESKKLRIILHGISSTPSSPYLAPYVHAAISSGHDVLCLALRGALGKGHDHYHAGLTDDVFAVLNDPRFEHYQDITLLGCSLGGLLALNVARQYDKSPPILKAKLKGIASICPPLNMRQAQLHLDRPQQSLYRRVVIASLKLAYCKLWKQSKRNKTALKSKLWKVMRVKTFAEWDQEVVLPRFGFSSLDDYYQEVSFTHHELSNLNTRSLLIFDRADPMVPIAKMGLNDQRFKQYGNSSVYITKGGGHIGFPYNFDLGLGEQRGIAKQVEFWFSQSEN